MEIGDAIAHSHLQIKGFLQIGRWRLHARIGKDDELSRLTLPVCSKCQSIRARQNNRSFRPVTGVEEAGSLDGRLVPQIPRKAIQSGGSGNELDRLHLLGPLRRLLEQRLLLLAREAANETALLILDVERHFAFGRYAKPVVDVGACRRKSDRSMPFEVLG